MGNVDYWSSYTLVPILVIGVIFGGIRQILILPLSRIKKTKIISTVTISAAVLNFGLNLVLIPFLSSMGAAISTAITQFLASVWFYYLVKKHDTIRYELTKIVKCLVLGLLFYGFAMLVDNFSLTWRLILKSSIYLSFFLLLYIWNFFEKIELERLRGAWNKWIRLKDFWQNIAEIKIE